MIKAIKVMIILALMAEISDISFNKLFNSKRLHLAMQNNGSKCSYKIFYLLIWMLNIVEFIMMILAILSLSFSLTVLDAVNNALSIMIVVSLQSMTSKWFLRPFRAKFNRIQLEDQYLHFQFDRKEYFAIHNIVMVLFAANFLLFFGIVFFGEFFLEQLSQLSLLEFWLYLIVPNVVSNVIMCNMIILYARKMVEFCTCLFSKQVDSDRVNEFDQNTE